MSFKEALAKARAERPEPILQAVAVGDELYQVEMMRLDGMDWAAVMAECPPLDEKSARLGYDSNRAALVACKRHSRLLDADGEAVDMETVVKDGEVVSDPWADLFQTISGAEIGALAAVWWALNMNDPNQRVIALKKALSAGVRTNLS